MMEKNVSRVRQIAYTILGMLLVCMILTQMPVKAEAAKIISSEQYNGWSWSIDSDGKLLVEGTVSGYFIPHDWSWDENVDRITSAELNLSGVRACYALFENCTNLKSVDLSGFDASNVTSMAYMFAGCSSLTSVDLSGLDTSNVTDMLRMFDGCSSLTTVNMNGLDTSNVICMASMSENCSNLSSVNFSGWDTSNVEEMQFMFYGCSSLKKLNLSGFDTSSLTTTSNMFAECSGLTNLNLSGFSTENVVNALAMFSNCSNLKKLDVSHFHMPKLQHANYMFADCSGLIELDVSSLDADSLIDAHGMFYNCSGLTALDLSSWDAKDFMDAGSMFEGCSKLSSVGTLNFGPSLRNIGWMFTGCSNLSAELTLGTDLVSDLDIDALNYYDCVYEAATAKNAKIVINYGGACTKKKAQAVVDTKSPKSNVVLGKSVKIVAATGVTSTTKGIKITWNNVQNADTYEVYRVNYEDGYTVSDKEKIVTIKDSAATTYTDTGVSTGNTYAYVVIGKKGKTVYPYAKSRELIYLAPTQIQSISNQEKGITLTWKKSKDAVGYIVYRSEGKNPYKKVKTLKKNIWTDTAAKKNGTKYSYKIAAYACTGCEYCWFEDHDGLKDHQDNGWNLFESPASSAKISYFLTVPSGLSVKNKTSKTLDVSWDKNTKATGYEIQYSLKSDFTSPKSVKVTKADTVKTQIKKLTKNKTYYVRIRAYKTVSKTDYVSAWSAGKKLKIAK